LSRDFVGALLQLNAEKQVSREQLIHAVEDGIQSAYRRVAGDEDIHVRIDAETGRIRVFRARVAVAEVEDPLIEFDLEEARGHKPDAEIGELVEIAELNEDVFGRIGAQTAKQIVLQRIREVERDQVFDRFASREGEMITGTVNRVEPRAIILDVGNNVEAILATSEQSAVEHYRIGQNVKAYVLEVRRSTRGPQIFVSRTHKGFLKRLFELEVPEIHNGTVEIRAIAREAGSRSKVAVGSRQEGLDPVGATVGQRGARVQAVVAELGGEKIDVIPWNDDPGVFVANALSPAQVISVDIDEEHRIASVTVPERMLSLAIGREGQNARLAARLTGWRIDIRSDVSVAEAKAAAAEAARAPAPVAEAATAEAEPTAAIDTTTDGASTNGTGAATTTPRAVAAPKKARATKPTAATASDGAAAATESTGARAAADVPAEAAAPAESTASAPKKARSTKATAAGDGPATLSTAASAPKKARSTKATAAGDGPATVSAAPGVAAEVAAEPAAKKPRAKKASPTAQAADGDGTDPDQGAAAGTPGTKKPRARKATTVAAGDGEASS
jgi:N utilization substance protein A